MIGLKLKVMEKDKRYVKGIQNPVKQTQYLRVPSTRERFRKSLSYQKRFF
jgi:hypothetical protein